MVEIFPVGPINALIIGDILRRDCHRKAHRLVHYSIVFIGNVASLNSVSSSDGLKAAPLHKPCRLPRLLLMRSPCNASNLLAPPIVTDGCLCLMSSPATAISIFIDYASSSSRSILNFTDVVFDLSPARLQQLVALCSSYHTAVSQR